MNLNWFIFKLELNLQKISFCVLHKSLTDLETRRNDKIIIFTWTTVYIIGFLWCNFKFSVLFGVLQAVCAQIRSLKLQRLKNRPRPPKTAHSNTPAHVYVTVWGDFHNTAQIYTQRKGAWFLFTVVLLLPPAPCPGDAVFRCESETALFGLPKEDTTRNQWLSCFYNTVPEQFNPNIRLCAVGLGRLTMPSSIAVGWQTSRSPPTQFF